MLVIAALTMLSVSVSAQEKAGKKDTQQHEIFYTCPMHDTIAMKKPGNCPVCGMKLQRSQKEQMKTAIVKSYACPVHLNVTSTRPGKCPLCGMDLKPGLTPKEQMKMEAMKVYTCPMHPGVTGNTPGKCPQCGMELKIKTEKN